MKNLLIPLALFVASVSTTAQGGGAPRVAVPRGDPHLHINPVADQVTSGQVGGPFDPLTVTYSLSNTGLTALNYTAATSENWVNLGATSGTIPSGGAAFFTVTFNANANALAEGSYETTITWTNTTNGRGTRTTAIGISVNGGLIVPGAGWGGPTTEGSQIGTGTAKCIARWDVVPHQDLIEADTATFKVGVVAFHIAGIDYVEFGVDGGSFVQVQEMTLNARTGAWEYVATLTLNEYTVDAEIEVRAQAYPNAAAPQAQGTDTYPGGGFPRLLQSLFLYVDADAAQTPNVAYVNWTAPDDTGAGTLADPFKTIWKGMQAVNLAASPTINDGGGGIVYLAPGGYAIDDLDGDRSGGGGTLEACAERWLTITNQPGELPGSAVINAPSWSVEMTGVDKIRVKDLTILGGRSIRSPQGAVVGGAIHGEAEDKIWFDNMWFQGMGDPNSNPVSSPCSWPFGTWIAEFGNSYWTGCEFHDACSGAQSNADLIRGCTSTNFVWGPAKPNLVLNNTYSVNTNGNDEPQAHPGLFFWTANGNFDNSIVCNNIGTDITGIVFEAVDADNLDNVAFVNNAISAGGSGGSQWGARVDLMEHILFWNNTQLGNQFKLECAPAALVNGSFRGNVWNGVGAISPAVWDDMDCDQNHYINVAGGLTPGDPNTPGSITVGDALLSGFIPASASPLRNRMVPVTAADIIGTKRHATLATVGAYE